ncbi:MAG: hypothetical protein ABSA83_10030, partial [Verrucomicrobiota bacterium]
LIIDLTPVETVSLPVVELMLSAIQAAGKLSLRCAITGSEAISCIIQRCPAQNAGGRTGAERTLVSDSGKAKGQGWSPGY